MAALGPELLVPSDPGRFRADNLLGSEDWDAALFGCLDDPLDPALLFPPLDPDPMFDCGFGGGEAASPPDPPWELEPPQLSPELQVKAEPRSPSPPRCQSPPGEKPPERPPERPPGTVPPSPGVKREPLPPRPCAPPAVKGEGPPPPRPPPPIQPKPPGGAPPSPPQTILLQPLPGGGIAAPPVLLSPAELLLPGLLCLPPPGPPGSRGPPRAPPKAEAKTIVPAPAPAPPGPLQVDAKLLKRQQRMIKNRESASQSRRRRKEYVQGLELRLRAALGDNERLRTENAALRTRLEALGTPVPAPPGPRRVFCVAALLLLVAFNLGPRSLSPLPPGESRGPAPPPAPPPRGQRHLLGVSGGGTHGDPQTPTWGPPRAGRHQEHPPPTRSHFRNASLGPVPLGGLFRGGHCPGFNRTESLRLADELSGWVRRHQIERQKPGSPPRAPPRRTVSPPRKVSSSPRLVPAAAPHPERAPLGQLQLYGRPPHSAPPFLGTPHVLAAIAPRPDTFYVVSFRQDHLLLPATSHNKTSRPKMSLVMPAAALNESLSGRGRGLAMMQVDCEVMDTRVIHVPRPPRRPPRPLYLGTGV